MKKIILYSLIIVLLFAFCGCEFSGKVPPQDKIDGGREPIGENDTTKDEVTEKPDDLPLPTPSKTPLPTPSNRPIINFPSNGNGSGENEEEKIQLIKSGYYAFHKSFLNETAIIYTKLNFERDGYTEIKFFGRATELEEYKELKNLYNVPYNVKEGVNSAICAYGTAEEPSVRYDKFVDIDTRAYTKGVYIKILILGGKYNDHTEEIYIDKENNRPPFFG